MPLTGIPTTSIPTTSSSQVLRPVLDPVTALVLALALVTTCPQDNGQNLQPKLKNGDKEVNCGNMSAWLVFMK
jgi:hypothetical protein